MRLVPALAVLLGCTACQPYQTIPAACSRYPVPVIVGAKRLQATVEACQQPDGGWRIIQYTPGLPPQLYVVAPPAAEIEPFDDTYPGLFPADWDGSPWFFGFAPAIVVATRFAPFRHRLGHRMFHHHLMHRFGHAFAGHSLGRR
ncbi:MAG TPA: hypothetical protein VMF05_13185 [Stellaceae bacterium]|nr:hypothetical protein [Stellaceae bacterium]